MIITPSTTRAHSVERFSRAACPPGPWSLMLKTHLDTRSFLWDLSTLWFCGPWKFLCFEKAGAEFQILLHAFHDGALWETRQQGQCALLWKDNTPCHLPGAEGDGDTVQSSAGTGAIGKRQNKICSPTAWENGHWQFSSGFTEAKMIRNMGIWIGMTEGSKYGNSERRNGWRKGIYQRTDLHLLEVSMIRV